MKNKHDIWTRIWGYRAAYLFISPFFILFSIFGVFPIGFALYLSFVKWRGFGAMRWVGLGNYVRLFGDDRFWLSIWNTIYLWSGHIFIMLGMALILAVILNSAIKMRVVYRTIIFLPTCAAVVAMALVFKFIYQYQWGILNLVLTKVGLSKIPWIASTEWSKISVILFNIWTDTGWYMIIYLAGLQSINPQLYEAAKIDGANTLKQFFYITIPSLRGIIFFTFIVETIWALRIFTHPYVLTRGGPENSTLVATLFLYKNAFQYLRFGYAATIGVALFVIVLAISLIQIKLGKKWAEQ